jgi:hypothetical protein
MGRIQTIRLILTVLVSLALASSASAALLGVSSVLPRIQSNGSGTTAYNDVTNRFSVSAQPLIIFTTSGPGFFALGGSVTLDFGVDESGDIEGAPTPTDLELIGTVNVPGYGAVSGTLLTASVGEFGWQESGPGVDLFDFRFQVTGGQLATPDVYPLGSTLGLFLQSETSTPATGFKGRFDESFEGGAKLDIGAEPSECELVIDKTCCIPPPIPAIAGCQGHVIEAVFEYTGETCLASNNPQEGKHTCSGDLEFNQPVSINLTKDASEIILSQSSGIVIGSQISFSGSGGKLKASTEFDVSNGENQSLAIHTSCSKVLNVCDQFGSMKLVLLTTSEGGTSICDDAPPNQTSSACELPSDEIGTLCESRPVEVVFEYTGEDCKDPLANDQNGRAECSGDPAGASDVSVLYTGKDPGDFTLSQIGNEIRLTATGRSELHADSHFLILDSNGSTLQSLTIHTSCSKRLALGDEFGALRLVEFTSKTGEVVGLPDPNAQIFFDACEVIEGGLVEYQYELSNSGASSVSNISVFDDVLGAIPSSPVLGPGQMETLYQTVALQQTTTNKVTAVGTVNGQQCTADDEVTVDVVAPPSGPFTCSKPIDELTMIWNGSVIVDVEAFKGRVGGESLGTVSDVAPGDEVTISGYAGSPNDVFWEIFTARTNEKLGESSFHLSCSDRDMNGPEDCGKAQGDGKSKNSMKKTKKKSKKKKGPTSDEALLNDWILEGMVDAHGDFNCTM